MKESILSSLKLQSCFTPRFVTVSLAAEDQVQERSSTGTAGSEHNDIIKLSMFSSISPKPLLECLRETFLFIGMRARHIEMWKAKLKKKKSMPGTEGKGKKGLARELIFVGLHMT